MLIKKIETIPIFREPTILDFKKLRSIVDVFYPETIDFELNIGYIEQATRSGCFVASDENSIIFCSIRPKDEGNQLIIATHFGPTKFVLLASIADVYSGPIVIKNVNTEEIGLLKKLGFREYRLSEAWDSMTRFDDNTYPEQILNTKNISELTGSVYARLREDFSRTLKKYKISIKEYSSSMDKFFFDKLLSLWAPV